MKLGQKLWTCQPENQIGLKQSIDKGFQRYTLYSLENSFHKSHCNTPTVSRFYNLKLFWTRIGKTSMVKRHSNFFLIFLDQLCIKSPYWELGCPRGAPIEVGMRFAQGWHEVGMRSAWGWQKVCLRLAWGLHEVSPKLAQGLHEVGMRFAQGWHKVCMRLVWGLHEVGMRFARGLT